MNTKTEKKEKKTVSEILSETIIGLMESQNGEYNNPFWLETPERAINVKSGRQYSGINKFMLSREWTYSLFLNKKRQ